MSTDRPATYEEFYRRRIREILEGRPITPNPFARILGMKDGKLIVEVQVPPDLRRAECKADAVSGADSTAETPPGSDGP